MHRSVPVAVFASAFLLLGSAAQAFECPLHFGKADTAIETAMAAMKAMPDGTDKGLAHTLIDDARMLLHGGRHNHEKPAAGAYDHARAIAKAGAAIAYAEAAEMMASR